MKKSNLQNIVSKFMPKMFNEIDPISGAYEWCFALAGSGLTTDTKLSRKGCQEQTLHLILLICNLQ